jgi:hypothetical protein
MFALALLVMGLGTGMFGSPNAAAIMNSVHPKERGVASGMMSTLMNTGFVASMGLFFTIVIVNLTRELPGVISSALMTVDATALIPLMTSIPPTGALFAAFLGYNPVQTILDTLPAAVVSTISPATIAILTGKTWFPTTLAQAFMPSLQLSFYIGAGISLVAAVLSALRGAVYINEYEAETIKVRQPPKRSFIKRK